MDNCPSGEDQITILSEEASILEQVNRVTQSDDNVSEEKLNNDSQKTGSKRKLQSADKTNAKTHSRTVKGQSPRTLQEILLEKNSGFNDVTREGLSGVQLPNSKQFFGNQQCHVDACWTNFLKPSGCCPHLA